MHPKQDLSTKCFKKISDYTYNTKHTLGSGSYGVVYLGKCVKTEEQVAIKVIKSAQFGEASQEISIMKQLRHPNIVTFIDLIKTQNHIYLVTEYCNGKDLKNVLAEQKLISEQKAIQYLKNIVSGLQTIIENKFIHRDLKPANIILHNDICKITDFGFSRTLQQNQVMQSLVGTPLYMSPQILSKQPYTSKCDIWSLGLIYYEMLFGKTPYMATNFMELIWKIQTEKLTFPKNIKISTDSMNFIIGCLQKEEKKRFDWPQVFNHPLFKPKMNIQIDPNQHEVYKPTYSTHRAHISHNKLPLVARDRSCSSNQQKVKFNQIIEQNKACEYINEGNCLQPTSSQSTECEDKENINNNKENLKIKQEIINKMKPLKEDIQHQYYLQKPTQLGDRNNRRTKSQLGLIKQNQSDQPSQKTIIQTPIYVQNITSKFEQLQTQVKNVHQKIITKLFERQRSPRQEFQARLEINISQISELLLSLEQQALVQEIKNVEKFAAIERNLLLTNRLDKKRSYLTALSLLKQQKDSEIIRKLEIYINLVQPQ